MQKDFANAVCGKGMSTTKNYHCSRETTISFSSDEEKKVSSNLENNLMTSIVSIFVWRRKKDTTVPSENCFLNLSLSFSVFLNLPLYFSVFVNLSLSFSVFLYSLFFHHRNWIENMRLCFWTHLLFFKACAQLVRHKLWHCSKIWSFYNTSMACLYCYYKTMLRNCNLR